MDTPEVHEAVELARRAAVAVAGRVFNPINDGQLHTFVSRAAPNAVVERGSASTCGPDGTSSCDKPVDYSSVSVALPMALGISIPLITIFIAMIYLHRRHVRRQRAEDAADRHASLDFGLGEVHRNRDGKLGLGIGEGEHSMEEKHARQMSMEDIISSPYLLPPELQNSRESLHSLSRTLTTPEDPYRPVTQYLQDNASMRSGRPRHDGSSIMTSSSGTPSRLQEHPTADLLSNAARMSSSNPPSGFIPPPRQVSLPQRAGDISPFGQKQASSLPTATTGSDEASKDTSLLQISSLVANNGITTNLPSFPAPTGNLGFSLDVPSKWEDDESLMGNESPALRNSHNYLGSLINREASPAPPTPPSKSSELLELQAPLGDGQTRKSPPPALSISATRPERKQSLPVAQQAVIEDGSDYGDGFKITPPSPSQEDEMRGQRYSIDVAPEAFAQAGLSAPGVDPRRISMGFRPLPPNADIEAEDPEIRANRIRSFYKEYFDESKPAPQGQYYEDYDENYLGDVAYYDPDSNNFVMPYAEPVTRRAMTPPPRAPRFQGQGPPRAFHGSMSAGKPGRSRMPPGPRGNSAMSDRRPPRGRPLPPPQALNSLPTPSKLRDDSFALMSATEFAPPVSFRDRQAGRSESPLGERRPYSPSVPAHRPLASAFDELTAMPSPHLLRKSGTFTGLDFAPPRKFRDDGTASDAGSIRSNRSGVSRTTNDAIRAGAYRVSRLPGDAVFTRDDLSAQLKPTWGLRHAP
ncbi:MAG: hypothetical protein M1818_005374 [Claussenomyces sp. TS43310]|nr:MAG: hypothetical protein M1818_005374 [Claussenomyces sp. TS43310]